MTRFVRIVLALTATLIIAAPPLLPTGHGTALAAAASPRILTASIPAATLTHLDLTALDGSVALTASTDPSASAISVTVSLDPPRLKNFKRPASADLGKVELTTTVSGTTALVRLAHADDGTVEARWTIVVPARFSAKVMAHDGAVTIFGIEGGVEASLNTGLGARGKLVVDVPRGKMSLTVGVGDVTASRRSPAFDRADVRATVGNAALYLLGHEIKAPHEPGPGHRVQLDGDGAEALSVRVSVGDASLRIG